VPAAKQAMVSIGHVILCLLPCTCLSHPESTSCSAWDIWILEPHRRAGSWLSRKLLPTYLTEPGPEHPQSPCVKSGSVQFLHGCRCLDKRYI